MVTDPGADLRDLQVTRLKAGAEPQDFAETLRLVAPVQALPDTRRLPLLDLAMPALRQMSPRQHSEGATAEKAVPFPCAVLDPNRSFVELRVGEPRLGGS